VINLNVIKRFLPQGEAHNKGARYCPHSPLPGRLYDEARLQGQGLLRSPDTPGIEEISPLPTFEFRCQFTSHSTPNASTSVAVHADDF